MKIYKDGQIIHYRDAFPSVTFPVSGPSNEFLAEHGAYKVSLFKSHDRTTQKLVSCNPYIEDGFAYTVTVENKTAEELQADVNAKAAQMRSQRNDLLVSSDWTQVADAQVDKEAWATYRQALRDLPQAEGWPNVNFPASPLDPISGGNISGGNTDGN